jgi:hypothetical protein
MGAIHFSIDEKLAGVLAGSLGIRHFVETGTFRGDTVAKVRRHFEELHTCELSAELHGEAAKRFSADEAVHCHLGSSPELLRGIARRLDGRPVLYWLDAHWCADDAAAGQESQCPLLDELKAIVPLDSRSVVWIDDARYFLSPPPKPLVSEGWPAFHEVLLGLLKLGGESHRIGFANDTILLYPAGFEIGLPSPMPQQWSCQRCAQPATALPWSGINSDSFFPFSTLPAA